MDNNIKAELIEVEYRDNNRIQVIRINSMTRDAVDAYVEVLKAQTVEEGEAPLALSVHDYSNVGGTVSPYFLGRIKNEFSGDNLRADGHGRVAVVTAVNLFRLMLNPLVKMFSRGNNKLAIQFFSSVDEAVEWVSAYEE